MGLDRPVAVQFLVWFGQIVRGDLGDSLKETRPVTEAVAERIPASLQLGLASWAFAMLVGWPLGVLSVVRRGTIPETTREESLPSSGRPCRPSGWASC